MSDVNQIITLGIGTPGDVEHFVLFGLSAEGSSPPAPAPAGGGTGDSAWELRFFDPAGNEIGRTIDFEYVNCSVRVPALGVGYLETRLRGDHVLIEALEHRGGVELWRRVPRLGVGWYRHFSGVFLDQERTLFDRATLTVRAWGDAVLLGRRIVNYRAGYAGRSVFLGEAVESVLKDLVKYNVTVEATTGNGRKRTGANWPGNVITVEADGAGGSVVDWYCHGDNLLETLQKLAVLAGDDWNLVKIAGNAWEFRYYAGQMGTDRTGSVFFSVALDNMGDPVYRYDRSKEGTVACVWGQGEEDLRDYVTRTGPDFDAANDVEFYVSATQVEYGHTSGLNAAGDQACEEARAREVFSFRALQNLSSIYKVHYELGDLVTARNPFTGAEVAVKVVGVVLSVNGEGEEVLETELRTV